MNNEDKLLNEIENSIPEEPPRIIQVDKPEKEIDFDEWFETIRKNFSGLEFPTEVAMSVISQILIKDVVNPFALVLVDVPSSGKTITINFFDQIEGISYASDKFTTAAFVSGAVNISPAKLAKIDLLPRLRYKVFLIRDLATLFSKRDDDLNESLGLLTRVLDGEGLKIDTGVHGSRGYSGEYLFMVLAASTPIPPRVWKMMGSLGSRLFFLNMNTKQKTEKELADQIQYKKTRVMEKYCREITKAFIQTLWYKHKEGMDWETTNDPENLMLMIARCAKLLARLRGIVAVWDDKSSQGEKYEHTVPVVEMADRINQLFYNICRGHALIKNRTQIDESDIKVIIELTIHSVQSTRADLFKKILVNAGSVKTSEVMEALKCSRPTALKEMEKFKILGICDMIGTDNLYASEETTLTLKEDLKWFVSEECMRIRGVELPKVLKQLGLII